MSSLRSRLNNLERRFGETSGSRQLDLFCRCVAGDQQGLAEFELLHTTGKSVGLLWQLYQAIRSGIDSPDDEGSE